MPVSIPKVSPAPRAIGAVLLHSKNDRGTSRLSKLHQSGSFRLLFPASKQDGLSAVLLNTAGGVTGGDKFSAEICVGEGSRLTLTTPGAERIYRAQPEETANLENRLQVSSGARLDWLPQETILFDHSRLQRSLQVKMAQDATVFAVEALVFGRKAMGEELSNISLNDQIHIWRGDELVFADGIRLSGDVATHLQRAEVASGAGAMASVLLVSPVAEALLTPLRQLLPETGGASLIRPGVLFARILAQDSFLLRKSLVPIMVLLNGQDIPRTWTM